MAEGRRRRKSRLSLPKDPNKDIEKIMKEIDERSPHDHEHHHHHHHHGEVDELLVIMELLIDSLNNKVKELEDRISVASSEIVKIYRVLGLIVKYLALDGDPEAREKVLRDALSLLDS